MSDEFLRRMHQAPSPEFARALRARLRALEDAAPAARRRRIVLVAASFAVFLAASLAFPEVRETARAVLDLFRERTVAEVRFDPARFADFRETVEGMSPAAFTLSRETVLDRGARTAVATPEAAASAADLPVEPPRWLPPGLVLDGVSVLREGRERLRVDPERLRGMIDLLDLREAGVPRRLAEGSLELRLPAAIFLHYSNGSRRAELMETRRPQAELSKGFDLPLLAEMGLRVLGVAGDEAHRLGTSIDWTETLAIELPSSASSFEEVPMGAGRALSIAGVERTLLWTRGDRLYAVTGNLDASEILKLAESIPPSRE